MPGARKETAEQGPAAADTPTMVAASPGPPVPLVVLPAVASQEQASLLRARTPQAAPDFQFQLSARHAPEEGLPEPSA